MVPWTTGLGPVFLLLRGGAPTFLFNDNEWHLGLRLASEIPQLVEWGMCGELAPHCRILALRLGWGTEGMGASCGRCSPGMFHVSARTRGQWTYTPTPVSIAHCPLSLHTPSTEAGLEVTYGKPQ